MLYILYYEDLLSSTDQEIVKQKSTALGTAIDPKGEKNNLSSKSLRSSQEDMVNPSVWNDLGPAMEIMQDGEEQE